MDCYMNFNDILELLRSNSINESENGTKFERLIKNWFLTAPLYRDQVKQVWLWSDFPYRKSFSEHDIGIDLVAETFDGDYWAIQCKCYDKDTTIQKKHVDSFISCLDKKNAVISYKKV